MSENIVEKNEKKSYRQLYYILLSVLVWIPLYLCLDSISKFLTYNLLGFSKESHSGKSIEFFLYDVPKVFMLLTLIVFVVGIIRSFFSPEKTRKILKGKKEYIGNILAALLGIVTPFCSCSAVPLFIGFVTTGIPLGVTLSFLISAPMVNEVALILLFAIFGWKIALIYMVTGLFIAIVSGWIIGRMKLERFVEDWVYQINTGTSDFEEKLDWFIRIDKGKEAVRDIIGKVWPYILLGIGAGAFIHGYVPEDFIASIMGKSSWWSVPVAVLLGVPMYSNAAGIIPVVQALLEKGASLGTVLAFMMSVIALSLPEIIIIKKVLKIQLILIYIAIVTAGIICVGYIFNMIM